MRELHLITAIEFENASLHLRARTDCVLPVLDAASYSPDE
jgi:hypothetical protein